MKEHSRQREKHTCGGPEEGRRVGLLPEVVVCDVGRRRVVGVAGGTRHRWCVVCAVAGFLGGDSIPEINWDK